MEITRWLIFQPAPKVVRTGSANDRTEVVSQPSQPSSICATFVLLYSQLDPKRQAAELSCRGVEHRACFSWLLTGTKDYSEGSF